MISRKIKSNLILQFSRFAEQHIYVLLATLLRHFKLEYNVDQRMDAVYHTLLFPDRPLRIKFKPRDLNKNQNK